MIRINAIPNNAAAKSYYKSADYYVEGQEQEAHWHGKGAELLGLSGPVAQADFERLCDNLHPKSGDQLTAKHIENRRVGYDFTFSVPKSLSVLHALGADDRIPQEFRAAVADTMAEMEREFAARVRKKGADFDRPTGNMVWADFTHHTSRPINGTPDPQLHIHAVVFNATFDKEENQWKAGQFGDLKANAPYFQAVFRARLANRMKALGYDIKVKKDDFEIVGVPERTLKEFSRRTGLIEKLADQLGIVKPESKAKLGATSREPKKEGQTWASLVVGWEKRLKEGELQAIHSTALKSHREPVKLEFDNRGALDWALRHLLERNSVVGQRELLTTALRYGIGHVTLDGLHDELGKRKDLIRRDMGGVQMVSTQGVLNEEKRIVAFAQQGRGKWKPLEKSRPAPSELGNRGAAGRAMREALERGDTGNDPMKERRDLTIPRSTDIATLSPSQSSAVKHALQSRDRLILIRGAAGTGKTTMTRALLEQVNVPWVILAPSAQASRGVLRSDGFQEAETLAKFLTDESFREKARNGLIVLDEASLAGAHDMARLVETADKLNARVLLLGDRRQHKSVARGDVLALLEDRAGLPVAEVSEIKRQSGEYKAAVAMASKGNVSGAIQKLDKLGWVVDCTDQFRDLTKMVADEYVAATKAGKSVLVVSPTHAEGDKVTAAIRERLKKEGKLDGTEQRVNALEAVNLSQAEKESAECLKAYEGSQACFVRHSKIARAGSRVTITAENAAALAKEGDRFAVYREKELNLAKGDLLRVTAGIKDAAGKRIDNGTMLTYLGSTDDGKLKVETANGTKRLLPASVGHLQHGYVATSHASQGRTVQRVLIHAPTATFGAVDKAAGYVAISRGKEKATLFTDDREALLEAVSRDRPRMLASELVRRPRHRVRDRLKRHVAFLRDLGNELGQKVRETVRTKDREAFLDR
jgi:conjugative relaxase-like TrwC/TraI family protein